MLPVNTQRSSLGTGHILAGPRLSTAHQAPNIQPSIHGHLFCRHCPQVGSSEDLFGDAPPPYHSLPPLANIAARSTYLQGPPAVTCTGRRVKSESCASSYHSQDDDFLANLAATQLLSGCRAVPGRQFTGRRPCCGSGCGGIACALDDLNLHIVSKVTSQNLTRSLEIPLQNRTTLHRSADGHASLESTGRVRMCAYHRSTPTIPSLSRERFPSEDLDRRLNSIGNALHRDRFQIGKVNKRLHTSEVSRKEQSLTADETIRVDQPRHDRGNTDEVSVKSTPRGVLGALRNLQNKDHSRHSGVMFSSPGFSETPTPCKEPSEVSCPV